MHIPDGLIGNNPNAMSIISPSYQLIIYAILAVIILAVVFYKYKDKFNEKEIPIIAMFTVATVIIQYIELPVPVAACVHVSLITVLALYDLETSMIVFTFVTIIQAFLFGEGGITTLGVNLLNLAILAPLIAYGIYHVLSKFNKDAALFISGFGVITLLGLIASIEYAFAGTYPINISLMTIVPIEALVGVLEGFVTVILMRALQKVKPELVPVMNE